MSRLFFFVSITFDKGLVSFVMDFEVGHLREHTIIILFSLYLIFEVLEEMGSFYVNLGVLKSVHNKMIFIICHPHNSQSLTPTSPNIISYHRYLCSADCWPRAKQITTYTSTPTKYTRYVFFLSFSWFTKQSLLQNNFIHSLKNNYKV